MECHESTTQEAGNCRQDGERELELNRNPIMRFLPLLIAFGSATLLGLSSCANSNTPLESRIESKIKTPNTSNVDIGPAHYNKFSQGFEDAWPFGPYSTFLVVRHGE